MPKTIIFVVIAIVFVVVGGIGFWCYYNGINYYSLEVQRGLDLHAYQHGELGQQGNMEQRQEMINNATKYMDEVRDKKNYLEDTMKDLNDRQNEIVESAAYTTQQKQDLTSKIIKAREEVEHEKKKLPFVHVLMSRIRDLAPDKGIGDRRIKFHRYGAEPAQIKDYAKNVGGGIRRHRRRGKSMTRSRANRKRRS